MATFAKKTHLDNRRRLVSHGRDLEVGLGGDGSRHAEGGAHEEALVLNPNTWRCHQSGFMINIAQVEAMMLRVKGFVSAPHGFTLWSLKSQDLWSVKQ